MRTASNEREKKSKLQDYVYGLISLQFPKQGGGTRALTPAGRCATD